MRTGRVPAGIQKIKGGDSSPGCGAEEDEGPGARRGCLARRLSESLLLCVQSLACWVGAASLFGFSAERPSVGPRLCCPTAPWPRWETSCADGQVRDRAWAHSSAAGREAGEARRNAGLRAAAVRPTNAKPRPAPPARPGSAGAWAGPREPRARARVELVWALGPRKSGREGVRGSPQALLLRILEKGALRLVS